MTAGPAPDRLRSALAPVPLVGVLRRCPPEHAVAVAQAAVEEGIGAIEVTMESERAAWQLAAVREAVEDRALVGAGTVTSGADVVRAYRAGAAFLVAPDCNGAVVREAHRRGVPFVPGVMTPTELLAARRLGVTVAKLFPAGPLGPAYLAALRGPVPDVDVIATGGIGPEALTAFLDAGALAVGVGGELFPAAVLQRGDAAAVATAARQLVGRATRRQVPGRDPGRGGGR